MNRAAELCENIWSSQHTCNCLRRKGNGHIWGYDCRNQTNLWAIFILDPRGSVSLKQDENMETSPRITIADPCTPMGMRKSWRWEKRVTPGDNDTINWLHSRNNRGKKTLEHQNAEIKNCQIRTPYPAKSSKWRSNKDIFYKPKSREFFLGRSSFC